MAEERFLVDQGAGRAGLSYRENDNEPEDGPSLWGRSLSLVQDPTQSIEQKPAG